MLQQLQDISNLPKDAVKSLFLKGMQDARTIYEEDNPRMSQVAISEESSDSLNSFDSQSKPSNKS